MSSSRHILRRGLTPYAEALALQMKLHGERLRGRIDDTALILEHPPVFTLGRHATGENLLVDVEELTRRGIELHRIDRGGDITFHGPGQVVAYFFVNMQERPGGVKLLVWQLEEAMRLTAAAFGVEAERDQDYPGLWVGRRKIGAVGLRIADRVTRHGLAFNVSVDLSYFDMANPCGIRDRSVTSLLRECGAAPSMLEAKDVMTRCIASAVFGEEG